MYMCRLPPRTFYDHFYTHAYTHKCTEAQSSRLFSLFTPEAMQWISSENITMNNHHWAVTTKVGTCISHENTSLPISMLILLSLHIRL